MNIKAIEYIIALANFRNFHNAANFCGVSQPALSSAIKAFEVNLGVQIFKRTTRSVELTKAGYKILQQAKLIQGEVKALFELADYHKENNNQPLVIAADESLSNYVNLVTRQIQQRLPEVTLKMYEESSAHAFSKLLSGAVDLAVMSDFLELPSGLISEKVAMEPVFTLVSKRHMIAGDEKLSLQTLLQETLILPAESSNLYRLISDALGAGISDARHYQSKSMQGMLMMINASMGIGFLPMSLVDAGLLNNYEIKQVPTAIKILRPIHLIWRANEERTQSIGHIKRIVSGAEFNQFLI